MPQGNDDLRARFEHHPPTSPEVEMAHGQTRANFYQLAEWVDELLPNSREKSLALTALDLAAMHTNAAIARGQTVDAGLVESNPLG